jgi:hypothetical protein
VGNSACDRKIETKYLDFRRNPHPALSLCQRERVLKMVSKSN